MTTLKTLVAAALLSTMSLTPVFAHAAIQEPGLFAFYHPTADVLNGGAPTPEAVLASAPPAASEAYATMESGINTFCAQRYGSNDPASGTFRERNARSCRRPPFTIEIPGAVSEGQAKANAASKTWPGDMILG
jgi:hypothetical protein